MGRKSTRWPAQADIPNGEGHVYTDGSAIRRRGKCRAGCGVWFGEQSPHNISSSMRGKQTANRAEMTAIVLALRKYMNSMDTDNILVVFSDSKLCMDGINKWLGTWKLDGWTRDGKPLKNADLWRLMDRVLSALEQSRIKVRFKHVPAHVGIYGNERADRLAGAAAKRALREALRTPQQIQEATLEAMANEILAACLVGL